MIRTGAVVMAALLAAAPPAAGQGAVAGWVAGIRERASAGDFAGALRLADSVLVVQPNHPSVVLAHAIALASAGRAAEARVAVERLLRWDARYARRALQEPALASLAGSFPAAELEAGAARADRPVARGHAWARLEERDLVPEGTAWDPHTRSVLVGSLNKAKVVAIAEDGSASDRIPTGRAGLGSVAGIHVDTLRRLLWVTSNPRYDQPADTATPSLFAFDAASGAFRSRHATPGGGSEHFLNDLTTSPDGTVFVTDTRAGTVWTLSPGAAQLRELAAPGPLQGPNGITISADGRHLFIADGGEVRVVALDGSAHWALQVPDSINVAGIDGLAFAGDALIAHHPLTFWRIARYPLDASRRAIVGRDLLEANTPDARTSTTGEVAGGEYVYIGNGQIDRMNAGTLDSAGMDPVRMYRIPLPPAPPGLVLVSLSGVDSVAVLDAQTLDRVATLPVGDNPHEIASHPGGRRAYIADAGASSISVIDAAAGPQIAATWALPDGIRVHDVAVSRDGRTVWAASGEQRLVLELDANDGRVLRRFPIDRPGSWMLATEGPAGSLIIANLEGAAVTLLDPATGTARVLPADTGMIDAAAAPGGDGIWALNYRTGSLTVFDGATGAVRTRHTDGASASRIVFTPDGRTALVVMSEAPSLIAYDVATRRRTAMVSLPPDPKVLTLSRDGRRAYVSHPAGGLTLVDVPSMTVLRTVELQGVPDGVALLEAGRVGAARGLPPGTRIDTVARGLEHPWGVAFSPDGRILVSERAGRIRVIADGALAPEPWAVLPVAQGGAGLLGLALSPAFPADPRVYVMGSYAGARDSTFVNRLHVLRDSAGVGTDVRILLDGLPSQRAHAGSAVAFGPDGMLYVTLGDAFVPDAAQDPTLLNGKVLRLTPDGAPAPGNPDPGSPVHASGLRNVQGLAWDPEGRLFATEHGPSNWPWEGGRTGHDEINAIVRGGNYGWPEVIGDVDGAGFIAPLVVWDPATAPSGLAVHPDDGGPWAGNLLVGLLRAREARRLVLERAGATLRVVEQHAFSPFAEGTRVRGIFIGPDGAIYVTSDRRLDGDGEPDDLLVRVTLPLR